MAVACGRGRLESSRMNNKIIKWMGGSFVVGMTALWLLGAAAPPKYTTFADLVLTNDTSDEAVYVVPHDSTNAMWVDQRSTHEGMIWNGRGAWVNYGPGTGGNTSARGFFSLRQADIETDLTGINVESIDSVNFNIDNYFQAAASTNYSVYSLTYTSPAHFDSFRVQFAEDPFGDPVRLTISNQLVFAVSILGEIRTPTLTSLATKTTNATPLDVAGQLGLFKGTNYINFNATNTPPASAVAPVKWVTVTADGTIYRLPLYQ